MTVTNSRRARSAARRYRRLDPAAPTGPPSTDSSRAEVDAAQASTTDCTASEIACSDGRAGGCPQWPGSAACEGRRRRSEARTGRAAAPSWPIRKRRGKGSLDLGDSAAANRWRQRQPDQQVSAPSGPCAGRELGPLSASCARASRIARHSPRPRATPRLRRSSGRRARGRARPPSARPPPASHETSSAELQARPSLRAKHRVEGSKLARQAPRGPRRSAPANSLRAPPRRPAVSASRVSRLTASARRTVASRDRDRLDVGVGIGQRRQSLAVLERSPDGPRSPELLDGAKTC